MKKILLLIVVSLCLTFFVTGAFAADKEMHSVKGPVVSVHPDEHTVRVNSIEGPTTGAENRWKGEIQFEVVKKTKIVMGKKRVKLSDLNVGEEVMVKFHEKKDGKLIADKIMIPQRMMEHKKEMK
jgi:hypothetical protein